MADETLRGSSSGWWNETGLKSRDHLVARRSLLLTVAVVLLGLIPFAGLSPLGAAIGFVIVLIAAALLPRVVAMGGTVTTVEETLGTLRQQMARNFADTLSDPCIILDRRSLIIHRNPPTARQFPGARIGDPIAFSLRNPALLTAIDAARRTGIAQSVELHQTVPTETWHKVTVAPLVNEDEEESSETRLLVLTMQTLTELKRVDAMRSDFIANVSHELRTPLTSLIGFIDTLLGPAAKDAEARKRFLAIMRSQAERMSKLIDDLLSLSRIEMRQHLRPTGNVDLASLLREIRDGLQTQVKDAAVTIDLTAPDEPANIAGDRDELYEVFENLIDNAVKYGNEGGKVHIELTPGVERSGYDYIVSVTDNGPGIAEEHVPRLTERFYRVDAESSRKKKGTGLGLAIVKHIVHRHRGRMSIKSRPGEGTRVEVLLPR
jgi:two-component system phosphate regulon sensor histidine kinase PhoR